MLPEVTLAATCIVELALSLVWLAYSIDEDELSSFVLPGSAIDKTRILLEELSSELS